MHGQQLLLLAKLDVPTSREMKVNPACLGIFLPVTDCSRVLDFYLSGLFLLILGASVFLPRYSFAEGWLGWSCKFYSCKLSYGLGRFLFMDCNSFTQVHPECAMKYKTAVKILNFQVPWQILFKTQTKYPACKSPLS